MRRNAERVVDLAADPNMVRVRDGRPRHQVHAVALPPYARALTTLEHVDYTDAFRLETGLAQTRTAEEWARAALEDAPKATRATLRRGWFVLGVRLGSAEDHRLVLGWAVRWRSPDNVLLAARSLIGMEAEVLVRRERSAVMVATFMHLRNPVARTVWAAFAPQHRRVLRHLLKEVARRALAERGRERITTDAA
jgi:hypothetical protein